MRNTLVLVALVMLAACEPRITEPEPSGAAPTDVEVVTYYDRNNDGETDLELHEPGCEDCDWALVDTDFNGRYEKHVYWGYSLAKKSVDLAVPSGVANTVGQPVRSGWTD
jgi:hypothetical protein